MRFTAFQTGLVRVLFETCVSPKRDFEAVESENTSSDWRILAEYELEPRNE
ncbi:hypothetical protein LEP1GSC133_4553 [Leptospira borgpetersenii serovar Pomona str. 200901868]|uniref:Uncharacterized protein n=1 Tax=Leptospira borgpetersenii serovar Pomona str. 200901868 TaxID=1192866 RepID=M6W3L3_LEPBO|nr:hypothetical protein LEP1GSC133_4553 [Leptospira borgpetersenii serovar Pomona str. 200901868]